jgi:hypothetical protein
VRDEDTGLLRPVTSAPAEAPSFLPDVLSEAREIRRELGEIMSASRMWRDFCRPELDSLLAVGIR